LSSSSSSNPKWSEFRGTLLRASCSGAAQRKVEDNEVVVAGVGEWLVSEAYTG